MDMFSQLCHPFQTQTQMPIRKNEASHANEHRQENRSASPGRQKIPVDNATFDILAHDTTMTSSRSESFTLGKSPSHHKFHPASSDQPDIEAGADKDVAIVVIGANEEKWTSIQPTDQWGRFWRYAVITLAIMVLSIAIGILVIFVVPEKDS
jgi:hypothetical protein